MFMRKPREINRTYRLISFDEHCVIQTNRCARSVFSTSVGGPVTLKVELPAPRKTLIKAACAKFRQSVEGKKHPRIKKALSNL